MVLLQLIGQGAFIGASLALGLRLLLLWRRTHEVPELSLGVAFLLGGGLGYMSWFALAIVALRGGSMAAFQAIALFGLACTCVGAVCNGIGVARIFRSGQSWPLFAIGALAVVMTWSWVDYLMADAGPGGLVFWMGIVACTPIYAWGSVEALVLSQALHKRARLGMADPIVVNRLRLWGYSGVATVGMIAVSFASRLVHGAQGPPWVATLNASLGLVAATAIWFGFFPPRPMRERLARAYEA